METLSAVKLGVTVARNTLSDIEGVMKYQENAHLTHAQRNGLDAYVLHLIDSLAGVLERTDTRITNLEKRMEDAFKPSEPESQTF